MQLYFLKLKPAAIQKEFVFLKPKQNTQQNKFNATCALRSAKTNKTVLLMLKESLIHKTLNNLARLPHDKVREVADFADFILKKYEEEVLQKGIEKLVSQSKTYDFLKNEENLYSVEDLKEKY
ncbi:MAG: hypothetical protein WC271_15895 [Bacteroidales bacterium]|jgi:hypothetical protein|nr:hypothetical protein [Bacteroidales bacterium]MDD2633798.1 hypothetical protein [Bacteroidales bacterium]MDD3527736.1 hypothetical protein [Bacteroidales bacterium]MDD4178376.1 hypothetical protein [Bacteroidales bacterium]MDD4742869.1 hypothetical protein [Bacteroidales bacterium]